MTPALDKAVAVLREQPMTRRELARAIGRSTYAAKYAITALRDMGGVHPVGTRKESNDGPHAIVWGIAA